MLNLAELWAYRELLFFFVWRDVKVRYKQTVLGAAWAVIQPLTTTFAFTLLFGRFGGMADKVHGPYALNVFVAMLPWTFFANAVTLASNSLTGSSHLISKVYFPRILIPIAAIAAGLVDFAIGSDTAGSVRLPASFCGIPGFRPTHGAVSIRGCMPLAPSYDTVGWFARDPTMLVRVGRVLLPPQASAVPGRLLVATDAFDLAGEPIGAALAPQVDRLRARFGHVEEIALAPESLFAWQQTMRVVQGYEVWRAHREWIGRAKPAFGPGIRERFEWASTIAAADALAASALREQLSRRLDALLEGAVLCMPTVPFVASPRRAPTAEQNRTRALSLLCVASLGRLPQVTLPVAAAQGCQVGLSLLGRRDSDLALLDLAAQVS